VVFSVANSDFANPNLVEFSVLSTGKKALASFSLIRFSFVHLFVVHPKHLSGSLQKYVTVF
jgi:hypothetical protein